MFLLVGCLLERNSIFTSANYRRKLVSNSGDKKPRPSPKLRGKILRFSHFRHVGSGRTRFCPFQYKLESAAATWNFRSRRQKKPGRGSKIPRKNEARIIYRPLYHMLKKCRTNCTALTTVTTMFSGALQKPKKHWKQDKNQKQKVLVGLMNEKDSVNEETNKK